MKLHAVFAIFLKYTGTTFYGIKAQASDKKEISTPSSAKRKASPLYRSNVKQKSQPTRKAKPTPLTADSLIDSFSNPSLISAIAPSIQMMIVPTIKQAVDSAVASALVTAKTEFLDEMIRTNNKLHETIKKQTELINKQQIQIDTQFYLINEKNEKVKELEKTIGDLTHENSVIKTSLNDLEQYGRRNSLRFNNLKLDEKLQESEMTKEMVKFININILKSGQEKITEADIDRCHPVGRQTGSKPKQFLVKFTSYHTKWNIFRSKGNLKNHSGNVFVCEDLTAANYKVVKSLNELKKNKQIYSFWTTNGNILARVCEGGPTTRAKPFEDIATTLALTL